MLFRVVCIVSAQNFDKDRLCTKIGQHRLWQNTQTWGPFLLTVPYKSWATFYLCCQFISDYVTWGPFLLCVPYKSWATFYAVNFNSDDASPNELKLQSSYDNNKIDNQPWRIFWWRRWWYWIRKQRNVTLDRILSMLLSSTRRRGRCRAHLPLLLLYSMASCESWFRLSADASRILHTPCFDKELVHCFLFSALRKVTTDKEICGCYLEAQAVFMWPSWWKSKNLRSTEWPPNLYFEWNIRRGN